MLRGETRPSRVNFYEPLPSADAPTMPKGMDARARAVWRRVIRSMAATGVIRVPDTDLLRCYAEAVSRYEQTVALYARAGPLIRGQHGELVKNPLRQFLGADAEMIRLFARELSLPASARAGLHVEPARAIDQVTADIGLPPRLRAVGDGL